ncbi:hypothetical protein FE391_03370 [Nonomuraea sp. KC401]|uniref:hypothetical protein n=1 Tax=unclassified Nonomuraea TaxID=2593643 RepID=UPI0010FE25E4|nr:MULTISPECIES: hypothetical protein [unclassified Nonomuraea]NBE92420.1 hypothetical protein [Nonomuraea sp. K271]TLF84875.1 hypothetical protein FE391_03370 [Nonomuraea sp. KC401]
MKLSFTVGEAEQHRVDFSFNQFWGNLSIAVDGVSVKRDLRLASLQLVKGCELTVGHRERHAATIEKRRERLSAGFRPQHHRVLVDGRVILERGVLTGPRSRPGLRRQRARRARDRTHDGRARAGCTMGAMGIVGMVGAGARQVAAPHGRR